MGIFKRKQNKLSVDTILWLIPEIGNHIEKSFNVKLYDTKIKEKTNDSPSYNSGSASLFFKSGDKTYNLLIYLTEWFKDKHLEIKIISLSDVLDNNTRLELLLLSDYYSGINRDCRVFDLNTKRLEFKSTMNLGTTWDISRDELLELINKLASNTFKHSMNVDTNMIEKLKKPE